MSRRYSLLGALALLLVTPALLLPCTTPVHRYAMYNWTPSTYLVCYLYEGTEDPRDAAVNQALKKLMVGPERSGSLEPGEPLVNLVYEQVDVTDAERMSSIPPLVGEAWRDYVERGDFGDARADPVHMIFSPIGALLRVERLSADAVASITESPARRKLGELLQSGNNGVLLFLPGEDESENARARKEIAKAIELAKDKIAVMDPTLGVPGVPGVPGAADGDSTPPEFNLRQLELSRDEPAERFLLEQLRAVEKLEDEERALPMVYCVYGRGRAMPPYLGAGIQADGLLEVIAFVNGPCSCEVKDQNPGVDLLMTWDWHKAALAMAERVGRESGNELLLEQSGLDYQEFSIDSEVVPSSAPAAVAAPAVTAADPETPVETAVLDVESSGASDSAPSGKAGDEAEARGGEQASKLLKIMLPVVGAAILGLGLATFVMLRRRA